MMPSDTGQRLSIGADIFAKHVKVTCWILGDQKHTVRDIVRKGLVYRLTTWGDKWNLVEDIFLKQSLWRICKIDIYILITVTINFSKVF